MRQNTFVDNAKVMSNGQIIIPKAVRDVLGVSCGDSVTFVVENNSVRIVNTSVFAMQRLQKQMKDETSDFNDDNVLAIVKEIRETTDENYFLDALLKIKV